MQIPYQMANRRAKRSEILDSWVLVGHIWDKLDLVTFKVILESFGTLTNSTKIPFLHLRIF